MAHGEHRAFVGALAYPRLSEVVEGSQAETIGVDCNMNVIKIVENWLKAHGYDGLYSVAGECACPIGSLFPCGECHSDCMAGYKIPCTCGEGCDFDIGEKK